MLNRCPVVHFEMPYDDVGRVSKFYERVFGWTMNPLGPESNNYVLAETTETEDGRPTMPGRINGGLFPRHPERPAQTPLMVIGVEDIRAAMAGVEGAGGKVFGEPDLIPNFGLYVAFQDCEGNPAAMLQPTV